MGLRLMVAVLAVSFLIVGAKAGEFPKFEAKIIDPNIGKVCYAVTISDVNGDKNQKD